MDLWDRWLTFSSRRDDMSDIYEDPNSVRYVFPEPDEETKNLHAELDGVIRQVVKEVRTRSETGGEKGVKLERYDLIPVRPLENLALRYGYGAQKYDERNWERGYEFSKSYAALQRHLNAFWRGEDEDEEMPGGHLAAAAFHIFALMQFSDPRNPEYRKFDDRPHEGEYADDQRI